MGLLNILGKLFTPSATLDKGLDLIDQMVTDKDKANEWKAKMYLAELQTPTIPIVDAIHKMGRQVLAVSQVMFYGYALHKGWAITPELVAGVSGATGIYTIMKGKGK